MTKKKIDPQIITGGEFYARDPAGRLQRSGPGAPDIWICRRLVDYPGGQLPTGGAMSMCCECRAVIGFNPARTVDAPKVCMQCAGIEPLPFS